MPDENILETQQVQDAIKDAVAIAVSEATKGLEGNRDQILSEKRDLSDQLKKSQEANKKFEGLDVDRVRTMMDAIEKSDEAKLISEGKIDDVISARTETVRQNFETEFTDKNRQIDDLTNQNVSLKSMYENKLIGDSIQSEAIKQGMLPEAIIDAVNNSNGLFQLNQDGKVISKNPEEFVNSPERYIKSLKDNKPYYWPANADFKMTGSTGGGKSTTGERLEEAAAKGDFEAYKKLREAK